MTHFETATPRSHESDEGQGRPGFMTDRVRLSDHIRECRVRHGRWFALESRAEAIHRFLSARLITTALVAGLLLALASLVS